MFDLISVKPVPVILSIVLAPDKFKVPLFDISVVLLAKVAPLIFVVAPALFYCKNNGIWDSVETGLTVDTDYLMSLATNYVITNTGCGNTGSSLAQIKTWETTTFLPAM